MAKICVPTPIYFAENVSFTIKLFAEIQKYPYKLSKSTGYGILHKRINLS